MEQQGIKVRLSEQPWQQCDCGGHVFEEKIMLKRISGLLTGQTETQHVPVQVVVCAECRKVPSFMQEKMPEIPEELKAKSKLNLNSGLTA